MRVTSACLLALAALLILGSDEGVHADDPLHITAKIRYNARTEEGNVLVTWDVSTTNNAAGVFVSSLRVPVLSGASEVSAQSADGAPLSTSIEPTGIELLEFLAVSFDRILLFGNTYDFSVTYVLPEVRQSGLLVTPFYVFLPLVAMGDEATVSVTTPVASAWDVTLEAASCDLLTGVLACSGSENVYIAGLLEVSQPEATKLDSFDVATGTGGSVAVSIEYFESEDATAAHQREVIEETLPLIADAYGFPYQNASSITVTHSGRQSVLGYEGLTECREQRCDILISPGTRDYTLVHELAHLWSNIFSARWLSEGFADWVTTQVVEQAAEGLLSGDLTPTSPAKVPLQLDEWEDAAGLAGASDELIETTLAGYDYSLRFVRTLAAGFGTETLRDVNRALGESGEPANSRRYMDVLEEVSGRDSDSLFLIWVFPESSRPLIEERREARDRYFEVSNRLATGGLQSEPLGAPWDAIVDWRFSEALIELDAIEANIDLLFEMKEELNSLKDDASALGLVVPPAVGSAIDRFQFDEAKELMASARATIGSYGIARERLAEPRNLWERFGLLGDDPDGELAKARLAFQTGAFDRSREHSEAAIETVDSASRSAMLRLLVVAGVFAAFAGGIGVAYWVAYLRRRRLAES